ncbi:hypothetical protein T492DRAFT_216207 [Pavlovales sp. CCMP2436]|nr:hypothetical protein T492DRAFT_216207 [Pavlovales sp. CCMP2436]
MPRNVYFCSSCDDDAFTGLYRVCLEMFILVVFIIMMHSQGSVSGHATSSSGSRSSSFHSSTSSSSASSSSRSSSNGCHVSQARGFNTGGGYAFHATPVRFTRPMFLGAGTTFILLHHGNRNGYGRGYNSHCATAGCALETDAPLAADEFLDASLEVRASVRELPTVVCLISLSGGDGIHVLCYPRPACFLNAW